MIIAPYFATQTDSLRPHPWTETTYKEEFQHCSGRYYDFRNHPDLIDTVLEDFVEYSRRPAVRKFYDLLKWINSDHDSSLETNDCAFRPPHPAEGDLFRFELQCDGRLEFFHRDLETNTDPEQFYRMVRSFCVFLQLECRDFSAGIVEVSHARTVFLGLPKEKQIGARVSLQFVAYGNTAEQCFANLKVVVECILEACKRLSKAWTTKSAIRR